MIVFGLALAGCQTVMLPSLSLNTAVTLNAIYGIAVNAANAYTALPLCRTGRAGRRQHLRQTIGE